MNNKFEDFYKAEMELRERYDNATTNEEREQLRTEYRKLENDVHNEGKSFVMVYYYYVDMRNRNNSYIDVDNLNETRCIPGLIKAFREHDIQYFSFSSQWSSTNETAWELVKNGCAIVGMIELNGKCKKAFTEEREITHRFLIRTYM